MSDTDRETAREILETVIAKMCANGASVVAPARAATSAVAAIAAALAAEREACARVAEGWDCRCYAQSCGCVYRVAQRIRARGKGE